MNTPTTTVSDAVTTIDDLLGYYTTMVVPLREQALTSRRALLNDIDGPAGQAVDQLITEIPQHRIAERPLLTYTAWLLADGAPDSPVPALAAIASELVHEGGLIHDDIVDNSPRRRYQPTHWARYAATHPAQPWATDFGKNVALWLGNLMLCWADDILGQALTEIPHGHATAARRIWTRAFTRIWASQHLDLVEAATIATGGDLTSAQTSTRQVVAWKGSYVATVPLHLGATLAGAGPQLTQTLQDFGDPLGQAYVLRNDLEGVFGTHATTDADADDLRERRLSTLIQITYNQSTDPEQRQLLRRAGTPDLTDDDAAAITHLIEQTGARAHVETTIDELAEQALAALDTDTIADWAKPFLSAGVHQALQPGRYGRTPYRSRAEQQRNPTR